MTNPDWNPAKIRELVESSLRLVLPNSTPLPPEDEDWIESGLVDSMAHVDFLLQVERALKLPNLFGKAGAAFPQSIRATIESLQRILKQREETQTNEPDSRSISPALWAQHAGVLGWGMALGSEIIAIDRVEVEFGLPVGTLKERAGIETIRRVSSDEDEISLSSFAARTAMKRGEISVRNLNWIVGTSETFQGLPSFAASLHTAMLAPPHCRVLDIGGGCVGLLNSFVVANALLNDSSVNCVLIASADVHGRILLPGKVPGEFGGLFGDGASAFILGRSSNEEDPAPYAVRASVGGCAGTFSSALQMRPRADGSIAFGFDGEALAHAAIDTIEQTLCDLEICSGVKRETGIAFAIHQPNHRLTEILLRRAMLSADRVPLVAKTCGNLGASTCGVALSIALEKQSQIQGKERGPIFAASVAPGMLWAGAVLA